MTHDATTPLRTGTLYWLPVLLGNTDLDPTETLLLVGLADHVNAEDSCWVGIHRLAAYARVSYGTARRRLTALEERGAIVRTPRHREDGGQSVYDYRLVRDVLDPPRNLDGGVRAPGRAEPPAHQDARAEPPPVNHPEGTTPLWDAEPEPIVIHATTDDAEEAFAAFWKRYPTRNGKRLGRGDALVKWKRLTRPEREAVMVAVENYRAACDGGVTIARDAFRWLRDPDVWREWLTPATTGSTPRNRAVDDDRSGSSGRVAM